MSAMVPAYAAARAFRIEGMECAGWTAGLTSALQKRSAAVPAQTSDDGDWERVVSVIPKAIEARHQPWHLSSSQQERSK
jgi:hypothetical protein